MGDLTDGAQPLEEVKIEPTAEKVSFHMCTGGIDDCFIFGFMESKL